MIVDKLSSKGIDVDKVVDKLYRKLNVSSDRALSKEMGLSLSAVNQARKRGSLPYEGVIALCQKKHISLDWLFDIECSTKNENVENRVSGTPKNMVPSEKEYVREDLITISKFVEDVMDQVLDKSLPVSRMLEVRKALAPVLIDAAMEYEMDESIVAAVARSTLRLV
ncbi:helix-turn-helix domain-containing protein [Pseudoalteromonas rubra]|uniref:helix-turn-helix domain-containing protein n=1 Tax=Pseudoalteromonas rubra TaxID=43658 RepID=UPI002DB7AE4E|nr:helix-turn-helix domain-containing protein [Pseudoalteromonas rubra]MEC4091872.1 helix-turn-helix domain-containing protein [Pseudoalteromonas rubra]